MKQTSKNNLFGSKFASANQAHKNDETVYNLMSNLPSGITGGIAKLVEAKIDKFKDGMLKGKPYFYAAGIVVSPKVHNGMRIEGRRTSIIEPLCDTPKRKRESFDDHLAYVYNELRKLGQDTSTIESEEDLLQLLQELKDESPYFSFSTSSGKPTKEYPEPIVFHNWEGVVEYQPEDGNAEEVVDNTEEEEEQEEENEEEQEDEEQEEEEAEEGQEEEQEDEEEEQEDEEENEQKEEEEEEEQEEDEEEEVEEDEEEEVEEDEEEIEIEKGLVVFYKPQKKWLECEVLSVNSAKQICNLSCLDDGKLFKNVSFADVKTKQP